MLLMVPLIGLTVGAQSLVGDRQDRSLEYLLAQPVSTLEIYAGKYLGAACFARAPAPAWASACRVWSWRCAASGRGLATSCCSSC